MKFHFNITDTKKDLLDPAILGTTGKHIFLSVNGSISSRIKISANESGVGILKAIKANAPSVKRVVITSSFASIIDGSKGNGYDHVYSEEDWNP